MPSKYYCAGNKMNPKLCTYESDARWLGRCPGCGRLYDIVRSVQRDEDKGRSSLANLAIQAPPERISSGVPEFDKVLGGGLVPGATIVITGPPGTGKSTLLLQTANAVAREDRRVLYTSGEQTREDFAMMASRFGTANAHVDVLGNQGDIYEIVRECESRKPSLLIVDSVNTAFVDDLESDVNSRRQIEAVANYLTSFGKSEKVAILLVVHVGKDGDMTGPRTLEHLVDAVIYFDPFDAPPDEDDLYTEEELMQLRVLTSSSKNRFGPSGTRAIVEMTQSGLITPSKRKSKLLVL